MIDLQMNYWCCYSKLAHAVICCKIQQRPAKVAKFTTPASLDKLWYKVMKQRSCNSCWKICITYESLTSAFCNNPFQDYRNQYFWQLRYLVTTVAWQSSHTNSVNIYIVKCTQVSMYQLSFSDIKFSVGQIVSHNSM